MQLPFGHAVVSWRDIRYVKIADLGEGGTADVFLAAATSGALKGLHFAVKVFDQPDRAGWRDRFMREVNFLRGCDHPAIMRVYDEGEDTGGRPFVVMEHLPDTLKSRARYLSEIEKLVATVQLLSALRYLARLDPPLVHRDIKPANIFFKGPSCVLGDFGLVLPRHDDPPPSPPQSSGAAAAAAPHTPPAVPEMAQRYRTPELVEYHNTGKLPSPESDVFQLGLVVAELFTGANPLVHQGPTKAIKLNPLGVVAGKSADALGSLIQRMLTPDAARRSPAAVLVGDWQQILLKRLETENAATRATRLRGPSPGTQTSETAAPESGDEPPRAWGTE